MSDTPERKPRATLTIAGKNIGLNKFVEDVLVNVVSGFLGALKKTGPGEVVITIPAERRSETDE